MNVIKISPQQLKYYERNNRKHPPEQIRQLMNAIREFGFVNPVLIDENDVLIAGHGRTEAAREMNLAEVPAIRLVGLSDGQKKALRIADNKIAENAVWDTEALAFELQQLSELEFDIDLLGFDEGELNRLLENFDSNDNAVVGQSSAKPKRSKIIVDCAEADAEALSVDINSLINGKKYDAESSLIK